jgi:hypothetical protein
MADTIETVAPAPVTAPIDVAAVQAAPTVTTDTSPTPTPPTPVVAETVTTPAPVTPIETPAPVVAEAKEGTLLAAEPPKEAVAETPKTETPEAKASETTNTDGGQSVEPAPPPTYDPFTLPEDIKLDERRSVNLLLSCLNSNSKVKQIMLLPKR